MNDKLKKLYDYLKGANLLSEAGEVLKIANIDEGPGCVGGVFDHHGWRWELECLPDVTVEDDDARSGGMQFRLLGKLKDGNISKEFNKTFGPGTQAYKNLLDDRHNWAEQLLASPEPSPTVNVRDYSRLNEEAREMMADESRFSVTPLPEYPDTPPEEMRELSKEELFAALPEPGDTVPAGLPVDFTGLGGPERGLRRERSSNVYNAAENWVDNIALNFHGYHFVPRRATFEEWREVGTLEPSTKPYVIEMRQRGVGSWKKFMAAEVDRGGRSWYFFKSLEPGDDDWSFRSGLENLRKKIDAFKPNILPWKRRRRNRS